VSIVAGVDFGTLSVRVSVFDSVRGRIGSGTAQYPLHRRRDDPDYATQNHTDQTGLLRFTRNNDRIGLVNPELGDATFGWNPAQTARDELFAAIAGTAIHTHIILDRMEEYGVPVTRVLNGGGIPRKNAVLNQVYADIRNKPILVPEGEMTSLAILAFLAAGAFKTVEEPRASSRIAYDELSGHSRRLYYALGSPGSQPVAVDGVLPSLRRVAAKPKKS
jgi:L-ribulokinase